MKNDTDYLKQLAEIHRMMEKTSRFISLSRFSGMVIGCYAIIAAYIASNILEKQEGSDGRDLIVLGSVLLVLSIATAFFFTLRRSKKLNLKLWGPGSKQLLAAMLVPLAAGGFLTGILILKEIHAFIIPAMLIFYGITLTNASRFSHRELFIIGILFIVLGLAAVWFPEAGLVIWATGFGLVHLIYGSWMYVVNEKKG